MPALIVYESMFGNTEFIARAITEGIREHRPADLAEVSRAPGKLSEDVSLLVVGGPTHACGMSRPGTRRSAADQAENRLVSQERGIREWVAELGPAEHECAMSAFDTKSYRPRLPGGAAKGVTRRLRKKGFRVVAEPVSFWVSATTGPLADGEIRRARAWGEQLAWALANSGGA